MIPESWRAFDVVHVSWFESFDGRTVRCELRDGRRLDHTVAAYLLAEAGTNVDVAYMIETMVGGALARAYRRCEDHEDCRAHRELGQACWQRTYGQTVPSPSNTTEKP